MSSRLHNLACAIRANKLVWIGAALGFVGVYYLFLLAAMVVRFQNIPNYMTFYDYIGNVATILSETPALSDAISIIGDEWLIEIGFMNYDYGHGVSEWSLNVIPSNLIVQLLAGFLVATAIALVIERKKQACSAPSKMRAMTVTSSGAFLVAFTTATLSWVVCCAASTWVVSLAMLGMSASLALWLEPVGLLLSVTGFILLFGGIALLANDPLDADRVVA